MATKASANSTKESRKVGPLTVYVICASKEVRDGILSVTTDSKAVLKLVDDNAEKGTAATYKRVVVTKAARAGGRSAA